MSAIGPMQTCRKTQSMSLLGVKRTWLVALHMSAYDPKRTSLSAPHMSAFDEGSLRRHVREEGSVAAFLAVDQIAI